MMCSNLCGRLALAHSRSARCCTRIGFAESSVQTGSMVCRSWSSRWLQIGLDGALELMFPMASKQPRSRWRISVEVPACSQSVGWASSRRVDDVNRRLELVWICVYYALVLPGLYLGRSCSSASADVLAWWFETSGATACVLACSRVLDMTQDRWWQDRIARNLRYQELGWKFNSTLRRSWDRKTNELEQIMLALNSRRQKANERSEESTPKEKHWSAGYRV